MTSSVYDFQMTKMDGSKAALSEYKGKVLLMVNVASKCGLTPQYEGLEKIYNKYKEQGFAVLGFPANEFAAQEPGSNAEIQEFCRMNYGVDFPMFEKIVVKGEGQHPLYQYLTTTKPDATLNPNGKLMTILKEKNLLSGKESDIKWNFEKFLIGKQGQIVARFSPDVDPQDPMIIAALEKELAR